LFVWIFFLVFALIGGFYKAAKERADAEARRMALEEEARAARALAEAEAKAREEEERRKREEEERIAAALPVPWLGKIQVSVTVSSAQHLPKVRPRCARVPCTMSGSLARMDGIRVCSSLPVFATKCPSAGDAHNLLLLLTLLLTTPDGCDWPERSLLRCKAVGDGA
jgi:hypothetical protein